MDAVFQSLKFAFAEANNDKIDLLAAGIAYYAFLSLVPLLAAMVLTYGLVLDPASVTEQTIKLAQTLPPSAAKLIGDQLRSISENRGGSSGFSLLIAIGLALFGARVAAGALIKAFNTAFGATESRGFVKANLLALAITLGALIALGLVAGITAMVSTAFKGSIGGLSSFLIVGLAGFAGSAIAYRVVPNIDGIPKRMAASGAALFAIGWMLASAAFGFYAANIASYDATYGSLGAIVVLLTWLFLSAYLLLFGGYFARIHASD